MLILCVLQQHPAFFGSNHKLIGIKIFEEEPEDFLRPICEIHGEPLCRACEDCTILVCVECDVHERFCNGMWFDCNFRIMMRSDTIIQQNISLLVHASFHQEAMVLNVSFSHSRNYQTKIILVAFLLKNDW